MQRYRPHTAVQLLSQQPRQRQCYSTLQGKEKIFGPYRSEPKGKARRKKYQKCENSLRRTKATEKREREREGTEEREKARERERERTREREKGIIINVKINIL